MPCLTPIKTKASGGYMTCLLCATNSVAKRIASIVFYPMEQFRKQKRKDRMFKNIDVAIARQKLSSERYGVTSSIETGNHPRLREFKNVQNS